MEATDNTVGKSQGAILAVVIILVLAAIVIFLIYCFKFRSSSKKPDVGLMFTNMSYGTPHTPVASTGSAQELSTVQIVKRGTTVGYDNPGFDSPMAFSRQTSRPLLSTMDWPESPAINSADSVICEGSSTPARSRASGRDDDSAFQEPSVSSVAASSFDDNRNFSVGDDDDEDVEQHRSVSFYKDKQRLIN